MAYDHRIARPHKNGVRSIACMADPAVIQTPAKAAIFLPGQYLWDIEEALRSGLIDESTYLIAVEREPELAGHIRDSLAAIGFLRFDVVNGQLESIDLRRYLRLGETIDFAYLDACNQITPEYVRWLKQSMSFFSPHAVFSITLATTRRAGILPAELLRAGCAEQLWDVLPAERSLMMLAPMQRQTALASIYAVVAAVSQTRSWMITDFVQYADTSPMVMARIQLRPRKARKDRINACLLDVAMTAACKRGCELMRVRRSTEGIGKLWQQLGCSPTWTKAKKAATVFWARRGRKPAYMTDEEWAVCQVNPKVSGVVA